MIWEKTGTVFFGTTPTHTRGDVNVDTHSICILVDFFYGNKRLKGHGHESPLIALRDMV